MSSYDKLQKIKALGNDKRSKIIYLLLENEMMSFTQLHKEIPVNPQALIKHLRNLERANIIENVYKKHSGLRDREYSFYKLTEEGLSLVKLLIEKGIY
jgi:predicted transcriptional regulator